MSMKQAKWVLIAAAVLAVSSTNSSRFSVSIASAAKDDVDWPAFSGHFTGDHYSTLSQINRDNVKNLRVAEL